MTIPAALTYIQGAMKRARDLAKESGRLAGDAEVAAQVSDTLQDLPGEREIQRTAVNHWLTGRRIPNLAQFITLCEALELDPGSLLSLAMRGFSQPPNVHEFAAREPAVDDDIAKVLAMMEATDSSGRKIARAGVVAVLKDYKPERLRTKRPK